MLTYWSISNFKSVSTDPVRIEFPGLTVLVGANSSGKSSIIQSILATAQSFRSRGSVGRPLILNGEYVRLGNVYDVLNERCPDEPLRISFGIAVPEGPATASDADVPLREVNADVVLSPFSRVAGLREQTELRVQRAHLWAQEGDEDRSEIRVTRRPGHTKLWQQLRRSGPVRPYPLPNVEYIVEAVPKVRADDFFSSLSPDEFPREDIRPIGIELDRFVPVAIFGVTRPELRTLTQLGQLAGFARGLGRFPSATIKGFVRSQAEQIPGSERYERLVSAIGQKTKVSRALEEIKALREKAEARQEELTLALERIQIPDPIGSLARSTRLSLAEGVRYLGPLREDPRAVYPLPGTASTTDVGIKGEYTAAVLHANRTQRVDYMDLETRQMRRMMLRDAVGHWLRSMEIIEAYQTAEAGKLGYNLEVRAEGSDGFVDLTSVGVGVSQVLPILVQTLLAPPNGLVVLEQPELHLHPAVQSRLGDFLLSAVLSGKRVLVETHSDHLLTRLRLRAAEGQFSPPDETMRVYFVWRSEGATHAEHISMTDRGAWTSWPAGFMDHSATEAERLMRASMRSRNG